MIDKIPEGKLIGTMEAPLPWIFSHTTRFVGIVRVSIHDGEGFILIDKGQVRSYYFRHGQRVLTGHAAQDYFGTQPLIHFSMYKLTPEEFSSALVITGAEGAAAVADEPKAEPPLPAAPVILSQAAQVPELKPALSKPVPAAPPAPVLPQTTAPSPRTRPAEIPQPSKEQVSPPGQESVSSGRQEPVKEVGSVVPPAPRSKDLPVEKISIKQTMAEPALSEPPAEEWLPDADLRMISQIMLGRIKTLPGVIAVLIFNKDMHLLSIGDVNLDALVTSAEDMLMMVSQLETVIEWGSFVQMTIQIPSGNVIIAPFFDEYLCILTSPDINLGQIRRILREIKTQQIR
jgi:predicted regulator of Ras-like GTPase activity (Roadblock/LC7/MglB family)